MNFSYIPLFLGEKSRLFWTKKTTIFIGCQCLLKAPLFELKSESVDFCVLNTNVSMILQDSVKETEIDDSTRVLPCKEWKKGGVAKIIYTHSSCPGLTCSLTCTSLGPYIMVHGMSVTCCFIFTCWCFLLSPLSKVNPLPLSDVLKLSQSSFNV